MQRIAKCYVKIVTEGSPEIKDEIAKTDKKIDEEVYKLYGLTEEEMGVVEKVDR